MMRDLCFLSIAEAAALIRKRALSPVDLTRAHLERIRRLDGQLRSYIMVTDELAVRQAGEAAEEIAAHRYRGSLHGIPISVKDIIATAGVRTTGGSRVLADWIPTADAHVVTRLRRAGVVMLGKATTFEFAWAGTSEEDYIKPARNPWNPEFSPGGSSSGSAAGVAAGLAMGSIASDSGGSIRNPAHLCGLTGLKPTYGRVGRTGVLPLSYSFDTVGPIARTAEDAAMLLEVMAGPDPADAASSGNPVPDYRTALSRRLQGCRIGILPSYMEAVGASVEVLRGFEEAVRVFRSLGCSVRELTIPHLNYARATTWTILRVEGFEAHWRRLRDERHKLGTSFVQNTVPGGFLSAQDYLRAQKARRLIARELDKAFQAVDLLLMPTNPRPASGANFAKEPADPKIARSGEAYVTPFNVNGSPAVSIPCGFSKSGLPFGLQIAGRGFEEGLVLGAAHRFQSVTDWHRRVPTL
jgi:aspartyl-tRNA(Asn)/glutamyl-tRNA(Gln) amidotransferase subunit A